MGAASSSRMASVIALSQQSAQLPLSAPQPPMLSNLRCTVDLYQSSPFASPTYM